MLLLIAQQLPTGVNIFTGLSVTGILGLAVTAFLRGWIYTGIAYREKEEQIEELKKELAGWKKMAFGTLRMGEQVTEVVKRSEFP